MTILPSPGDHVPQKTYGTITPGLGTFGSNNVVLTTQFADNAASPVHDRLRHG